MNELTRRSMTDRMKGAAMLDVATYEEVEHDESATSQAAVVVGLVALAAAIGSIGDGVGAVLGGVVMAYLGWLVWAGVTYLIGDKILGGTATWGELLRTLGFAQSPGLLYALGIIPILGAVIGFFVWIWLLIAAVIAIRQALDFSTGKAVLTGLLGLLAYLVVGATVAVITGVGGLLG